MMDPTAGGAPPPGMGPAVPRATPLPSALQGVSQIVPDHYQAPASSRASAAFRQSAFPTPSGGVGGPAQGGSKAGVVIAILGVLAIGAAATALLFRSHDGPTPAPSSPTGVEKPADTGAARPLDTVAPPTATVTAPPVDLKTAPPAVSAAEPPTKAAPIPGGGIKAPAKGPSVAPTATHAPAAPTPPTPPPVDKTPVDPLNPGKRQG